MTPGVLIGWSFAILIAVACAVGSLVPVLWCLAEFFGKPREWDRLERRIEMLEDKIEEAKR